MDMYTIRNYCVGKLFTNEPLSDIAEYYTLATPISVDNIL
jgi:hypothetical protein